MPLAVATKQQGGRPIRIQSKVEPTIQKRCRPTPIACPCEWSTDARGLSRMSASDIRDTFVIMTCFGRANCRCRASRSTAQSRAERRHWSTRLCFFVRIVNWLRGYFCERREVGVVNIGAPGWISSMACAIIWGRLDSLYIGRGVETAMFGSNALDVPGKFYFVSYPAHASYASRARCAKMRLEPRKQATRRTQSSGDPAGASGRVSWRHASW